MGTPLNALGGQITSWDDSTVEFTGPTGSIVRMSRAHAPASIQQAVAAAESGGGVAAPTVQPGRVVAAQNVGPPMVSQRRSPDETVEAWRARTGQQPPMVEVPITYEGVRPRGAPTTRMVPASEAAGPAANAAAEPEAQAPATAALPPQTDPLDPIVQRIAELRSQPQVVRGGGGTRTATSVTAPSPEGVEASEVLQPSVEAAQGTAASAREAGAGAESAAELQLGTLAGQQAAEYERALKDDQTDQQRYQERLTGETAKLQALQDASRTEIDPGRWWREKATGKKILAGLGAAIGGYALALRGGNAGQALDLIKQSISQDIDAQLQNRDDKRRAATDQAGFMAVLQDQYSDKAQARKAGLILGQELVAAQAERIGHQARSETVKQKALEVSAQLKEDALRQRQQFLIAAAGQTTTQTQQVGGGVAPSAAAVEADALSKQTFVPFDPSAMIPAAERYTGTPMQAIGGDAKDINKQMSAVEGMMAKIQRLKAMGRSIDKNKANSLYASLILDGKNVDQAGALDLGTEKIMRESLGPNPAEFFRMSSALPTLETSLRAKIQTELRNRASRVDPNTVPLGMRARFSPVAGGTTATAGPRTQPLNQPVTEEPQ